VKIAVTGILACGKSSVTHSFKELGAYVVSADQVVHQLLNEHQGCKDAIIELLGEEIATDGRIDRKKIGEKVFASPELLEKLEAILHPAVGKEIDRQYQEFLTKGDSPLFVAEIPLLFEASDMPQFDKIIAVVTDEEKCRKRFSGEEQEFNRRMARQLSQKEKASRADIVIKNDGTLDDLKEHVKQVFNQLTTHKS